MIDTFQSNFNMTLARDPQSRYRVYNIRYQVYCQEYRYEQPDFPTQQETDEYDLYSDHCLLTFKPASLPIGCIRLVKGDDSRPDQLLPYEHCCLHVIDRRRFDPAALPRGAIAEFSRLAITRPFRARCAGVDDLTESQRYRTGAVERFGLFLAGLALLLESDCRYGVAMMESRLARMLARVGIHFEQVGPSIDYHGPRAPFVIRRERILPDLSDDGRQLMAWIRRELGARDPQTAAPPDAARARSRRWKADSILPIRPLEPVKESA